MSSSVSRSLSSLSAARSTAQGEAPRAHAAHDASHLLTPQYWQSALNGVVAQHEGSRCLALAAVHAQVVEALKGHAQVPIELEDEFEFAAADLADAMAQPESDLPRVEERFVEVTAEVVAWHNRQTAAPGTSPARYGGSLGHAIFGCIIGKHTASVLTACLREFAKVARELSYDDQLTAARAFVAALLDVAAKDRHLVARMSATPGADSFGAKMAGDHLCIADTIRGDWRPWSDFLSRKAAQIIEKQWTIHCLRHGAASLGEFLLSRALATYEAQAAIFTDRPGKCALILDLSSGLQGEGLLRSDPFCNRISVYSFRWSIDVRTAGGMQIFHWKCFHPQNMHVHVVDEIAPYVKEALGLDPGAPGFPSELKRLLGAIEYAISHSSTWVRGQASISKMLIEAIASFHGLELTYGAPWSAPNAQLDQHALSEFNADQFVADAVHHLKLNPAS